MNRYSDKQQRSHDIGWQNKQEIQHETNKMISRNRNTIDRVWQMKGRSSIDLYIINFISRYLAISLSLSLSLSIYMYIDIYMYRERETDR